MKLHHHLSLFQNSIYISLCVDVIPHKVHCCFQYNITPLQRMQLFWLNASVITLPYGEHEICFLTEEALDHYLFLNPYLWDENDGGCDYDEED